MLMNLKDLISSKNLSILALSKLCAIPYATLYESIKQPKKMSYETMRKLSSHLGLSLNQMAHHIEDSRPTLASVLIEQMNAKLKGNLYHHTQIHFAYNTNRIEGSRLTEDQTRLLFETNAILPSETSLNTDDLVETANTFAMFDWMLKTLDEPLNEPLIKTFHQMLKTSTSDARFDWFAVGEYKLLSNEVGGRPTTKPKQVEREMRALLSAYHSQPSHDFDSITEFHVRFERIHPFQDGNGRVGRIVLFRECLKHGVLPFIVEDDVKPYYYRGLSEYDREPNYLLDTFRSMQDRYFAVVKQFLEESYAWNDIISSLNFSNSHDKSEKQ